jgi:hypothetical protein
MFYADSIVGAPTAQNGFVIRTCDGGLLGKEGHLQGILVFPGSQV